MKKILFCTLLVFSVNTMGQSLTVIYDSGNTLSIAPYHESVQKEYENPVPSKPLHNDKSDFSSIFPVETQNMTPDIVDPQPLSLPSLPSPLFIIGNDELSLQWLVERRAELIQLRAVGMLIEVSSIDEFNSIKELGRGLHIYPASGVEIGEQLNLEHYPALISSIGIEQ